MRNRLLVAIMSIALCISFATPTHAFLNSDISKAKDFIKADMYPQAIELLNKRIIDEPTDADAHLLLGECYAHQGNWSQAEQRFNSAVKLDPSLKRDIALRYKGLADRNLRSNNLDSAQSNYNKALAYDPSVADDEFQKQIGYQYLKKAAETKGGARETYKRRAAGLVGNELVTEVFPGEKTITVFEKTYTYSDAFMYEEEYGFIKTFRFGVDDVKVGDQCELNVTKVNGEAVNEEHASFFRGETFKPMWLKFGSQGYTQTIEVSDTGKYLIVSLKDENTKITVRVTRKITPEPNIALLNSLIK